MNDNKNAIIGLAAVIVIAIGALVFFMTRGSASSTDVITDTQKEMDKQVPAGLGKPTKEQATEGLMMMGAGKGKGGTMGSTPPPQAPPTGQPAAGSTAGAQ